MILGESLFKMGGEAMYSPEFRSQGLAALLSCSVTQIASSPSLTITPQTRNTEDTTWTDLTAFSAITAIGNFSSEAADFKEIVRFKFQITGASVTSGMRLQMNPPSWRPYT